MRSINGTIDICIPNIGDFQDIPVIEVLVKAGDTVRKNDSLITLESAKASVEIPSPESGVIQELTVRVGDRVSEGWVIGKLVPTDGVTAIASERVAATEDRSGRQRSPVFDSQQGIGRLLEHSEAKKAEIAFLSSSILGAIPSTLFSTAFTRSACDRLNQRYAVLRNTVLPPLVFEVNRLLRAFPLLNAMYDLGGTYVYNDISIGIAIDSGNGLRVARVPAEAQQSIAAIEQCILDLGERDGQHKLGVADLTGTTFTITDLSSYGVTGIVPVLNRSQSAILGVVAMNRAGEQVLSVTFDHRVTEGRYVAQFLRDLVARIESYGLEPSSYGSALRCRECSRSLGDDKRLGGSGFFVMHADDGMHSYLCSLCARGY